MKRELTGEFGCVVQRWWSCWTCSTVRLFDRSTVRPFDREQRSTKVAHILLVGLVLRNWHIGFLLDQRPAEGTRSGHGVLQMMKRQKAKRT